MKRIALCFLAAVMCIDLAHTLECYFCLTPTPADQCRTSRNCSSEETWCFSTVYGPTESGFPFKGSRNVVRDCAQDCRQSNPNSLGNTRPTHCCQGDNCNIASGATMIKSNYWVSLGFGTFILFVLQTKV